MARKLSGYDTLGIIDDSIVDMRRMLSDAIAEAEQFDIRQARVQSEQVELFRDLAAIRLDVVQESEGATQFDAIHAEASRLMDEHDVYVQDYADALSAADDEIRKLETTRNELAGKHLAAVNAYEDKVADVEAGLAEDVAYNKLIDATEETAAVAARAHQKLDVAVAEVEEKGAPYREDALFMYLWERKFRSPEYDAGLFTRMMDGWVAKLCKYDQAFLNFERLTNLPVWLEQHAQDQDEKAEKALAALESAEQTALQSAGANTLQDAANTLLQTIRETDQNIDRAEVKHADIAAKHAAALREEAGPAKKARTLLSEGLRKTSFQSLRTMSAETVTLDDDRIVDRLVKLRTEEVSNELEQERAARRPERFRESLGDLEYLRRQFKRARYDGQYSVFPRSSLDDVLSSVAAGRMSGSEGFRRLARSLRRLKPKAEPGFGGMPRSSTIGLPGILGDVLWEVAKEASRGSGGSSRGRSIGFPTSAPRKRRSPRINMPRRRSSGGRRSGGGGSRGGGGFKTGGGF